MHQILPEKALGSIGYDTDGRESNLSETELCNDEVVIALMVTTSANAYC